ncbi:unnamed protein product [Chrysoparadoxa australica]
MASSGGSGELVGLVQELVHSVLLQEVGDGDVTRSEASSCMRLSMRILGSQLGSPMSEGDEGRVRHSIDQALQNWYPDRSRSRRFQQLFHRLRVLGTLTSTQRWSILHLLEGLSQHSDSAAAPPLFREPSLTLSGLKRLGLADEPAASSQGVAAPAALPPPPGPEPSGLDQITSIKQQVPEQALLADVLFAFQGIDGHHVKFSRERDAFIVDPGLSLPCSTVDLICKLCELGWLYGKVVSYIKQTQEQQSGQVRQAFCFSLHEELTDYYRLIAILEAHLAAHKQETQHHGEGSSQGLTLRRLSVWVKDPMDRMHLMATLVEGAGQLQGGALASCLHTYMHHGDPFVRGFLDKLMRHVCQPIFNMLKRWVYEGELQDDWHEFFVACHPAVPDEKMWQERYFINDSVLPRFLSREVAHKILVIGKAINFVRQCCGDESRDWIMNIMAAGSEVKLVYGETALLHEVVERCSALTNQHILEQVMGKHQLLSHLRALKKFMLLGQGDFVTTLMDQLGPELGKRASQIYKNNLTGVVDSALRASNLQYESSEILDRVGVRLLEPSAGDSGWEVFSLDYMVESPITAVIDSAASLKYRRMFHLLWRIKRAEWSLAHAWSQGMMAMHTGIGNSLPQLRRVLHHCSLLRGQMVFFISNLSNYMMFEVLETSWTALMQSLEAAKDLDDVIGAHSAYLETVMQKALVIDGVSDIMQQLNRTLDVVLQFCSHQEVLMVKAVAEMAARREEEFEKQQRTEAGEWGITADTVPKRLGDDAFDRNVLTRIEEIAEAFRGSFSDLLMMLEEQSKGSEILRFLTFRLDFNLYWSSVYGHGQ